MSRDSLRIDLSDLGIRNLEGDGGPFRNGRRRDGNRSFLCRALRVITLVAFLTILPFFTLVRVSVFLFHRYEVGSWVALGGGAVATVLLLVVYLSALSLRFGGKGRVSRSALKGTAILVGAYCLFAVLYLSAGNAKTPEVRDTFRSLNPILRVGVSTLLLVDRDGVLTDAARRQEDYAAMGLPANEASLHLPQEDGLVYAVDIRTLGRPEWRNGALVLYFRTMGFGTLRHTGTADHLHVYLTPRF